MSEFGFDIESQRLVSYPDGDRPSDYEIQSRINYLQQENQQLKDEVKDLKETHYLIQGGRSNGKTYLMKLQKQRDLYKSVIDEIKDYIFNHELVGAPNEYVINVNALLEILDKASINEGNENE